MPQFRGFVIFGEMRTGSNFLEAALNQFPDICSYGEVFNPVFLGHPKTETLFDYDLIRREEDPLGLMQAIFDHPPRMGGFRFFHDHHPRVVDAVLSDPSIAKVILTRNPLDSYVSRKIAAQTGQWMLRDMRHQRAAQITFDMNEFRDLLSRLSGFQRRLTEALQTSGQGAYRISYEDLFDVSVINGLARYLGTSDQIEALPEKIKKQNPEPLSQKVVNYDEMMRALAELDPFGLSDIPIFEPSRHAAVPSFVATPTTGLLFQPMRGSLSEAVIDWMAAVDGVGRDGLHRRMSQNQLRQWMRAHEGFRSFAIIQHPLARAYDVFTRYILPTDRPHFATLRRVLLKTYGLVLPAAPDDPNWTPAAQKIAFSQFLKFLRGNLSGQTGVPVDQAWATQSAILQGMAQVKLPDLLLREEELPTALPALAGSNVAFTYRAPHTAVPLLEIYDDEIEALCGEAYRRDYISFGFGAWRA
ncbi:sulfotransferase [Rhodobacteraceae bacterium XHP0102]|nr:sulfotransferase [Rhodobacteraceae bacterium XHP0102]